jgi:cbb3-type cytochrome oxidase maturation protein
MIVIYILIPIAIILGGAFLSAFIFMVRSGQYDDLDTPAQRILIEEQNFNSKRKLK